VTDSRGHKADASAGDLSPCEHADGDDERLHATSNVGRKSPTTRFHYGEIRASGLCELVADGGVERVPPLAGTGEGRRGEPQFGKVHLSFMHKNPCATDYRSCGPESEDMPTAVIPGHVVASRRVKIMGANGTVLQIDLAAHALHFVQHPCVTLGIKVYRAKRVGDCGTFWCEH
jgi:hypothetical protein